MTTVSPCRLEVDHGNGQPLSELCGVPMEPGRFLPLAIGIAGALAALHEHHIIHKGIKPRIILVHTDTGAATITDFSIASRLPYEYPSIKAADSSEGALAYLSPEQTGRMNRMVDHRSDLYALGVIFYEMLTGTLPFQARDALEWVHCHIAREPQPLTRLTPSVPAVLATIVMKLLAKAAEDRYQTATGLKVDLRRCLEQWQAGREIQPFALGEADISDRLLIPQRLYGRETEIASLLAAFDRVVEQGTPELVMVAGYSGIGKTALVRELYRPLMQEDGLFISGKFDQHKRNIPYSTLVEAFRELIQQILTETEDRIGNWRQRLANALESNGQLMVDIIPQVELIIGKQPPVAELPLTEAENQFNLVFRRFLGVFATREHPLVIFLDDLQWVDAASLRLLQYLITDPDSKYLLLIGAYRDNEVGPDHPLMVTLNGIIKSRAQTETITLAPLCFDDLSALIADALGAEASRTAPLARLIDAKTGGNPFFVIQFLRTLHGENLLELEPVDRRWTWDIDRIQAKGYTDNVVDLMVRKLRKLSTRAQQVLRWAACIGNEFDLATLVAISDIPGEEVEDALWEALHEGMVLSVADNSYTFLHDRVLQAAYSLIPEGQQAALHLRIGRLMIERTPPQSIEERVFAIVNHFNLGSALIGNYEEKILVAELNLLAGKKARASTAYVSALGYLSLGAQLLAPWTWQTHYDLTFDLYKEYAIVEYLNSNYVHSQELIDLLLSKAQSKLEKAELYNILIIQYTLMAKYQEAMNAGLTALRLLNVSIPTNNIQAALDAEVARNQKLLDKRGISFLIDAPEMTDPKRRISIELLSNLLVPARYTDNLLFALMSVLHVNLSLKHGPTAKSTIGYTAYGMFLNSVMHSYREAYEFGELALKNSERFNDLAQKCQACMVLGHYLSHWVQPLELADHILEDGYRAGVASGDLQWTGYTLAYKLFQPFYRGVSIDSIRGEIPDSLAFTQKTKNQWATDTLLGFELALSSLKSPSNLLDAICEDDYLSAGREHRSNGAIGRYAVVQAQVLYLYGQVREALKAIALARDLSGFFSCSISIAELHFYHSLILAAAHDQADDREKAEHLEQIQTNQSRMKTWVDHCEANFGHQYLLVEAELARISGRERESEQLYERAVRAAQLSGFVQDQALAHELTARFYLACGFTATAHAHLREARAGYARWGADGKVKQLDEQHPWLAREEQVAATQAISAQIGHLDALAVVRASQAISGEIVLGNLLETLMRMVVENAGAQKGCLILDHDGEWAIAAEARVEEGEIQVLQPGPRPIETVLPISALNYVIRTREPVIVDDASVQNMFSADAYFLKNGPGSVMCLPLLRQANLIGLLYLENNLVKGAFTADRVAVLELLAAQAAISLENAALYLERSRAEAALRQSEERYRALYDDNPSMYFTMDAEGTVLSVNRFGAEQLGYGVEELVGQPVLKLMHADDVATLNRQLAICLENPLEVSHWELRKVRKDASVVWVKEAARAVRRADSSLVVLVVSEDVTERKLAEEELARLATVIEQVAEGIMVTDRRWRIGYINPAFERISGYARNQLIGQHAAILKSDKHDPTFYHGIRTTLTAGNVWSGRIINRKQDGSLYQAEVTASPMRDQSGVITNYVATHRDITHEVSLERDLRQAQKMQAIGTLAGGIAHDFNNILMAITGYTEMALLKGAQGDQVRHHLEQILKASSRAAALVKQILTVSRTSEQERKPMPIVPSIKEALRLLRSSLPSTIEIRQEIEVLPEQGVVLADPTQIHQVLMNLCTNAAHAMRAEGGVLTVRLVATKVDSSLAARCSDLRVGPYVRLTVSDTGHGMDASVIERIFDPYFTTKGVGEGSGMGLAVVQGIVRNSGGAITVHSEPGEGATFHVYLPRSEVEMMPETSFAGRLPTGSQRILFVDDEKSLVELGKEMLESLGYRVSARTSSIEALEDFRAQPYAFDLVITDMTMPGLTGRELTKALLEIRKDIPIVLCSGFSELINERQAREAGIRAFIMKPYVIGKFAETIRKILEEDGEVRLGNCIEHVKKMLK